MTDEAVAPPDERETEGNEVEEKAPAPAPSPQARPARWGKRAVLFGWVAAAAGGAASFAAWHHYGPAVRARFFSRQVELTLVASDAQNLACGSGAVVGGLRCAYDAEGKPWPAAPAGSASATLQPFTTTDKKNVLGAGLWTDPGLKQAALPAKRFSVRCKFVEDGAVKSPSVRWSASGKLTEGGGTWPAGTLSDCAVGE